MASRNHFLDPELVSKRVKATESLLNDTHNPIRHLERGKIHLALGFPDLAATDAYRALTLFDSVLDSESEFPARKRIVPDALWNCAISVDEQSEPNSDASANDSDVSIGSDVDEASESDSEFEDVTLSDYHEHIGNVYTLLVASLAQCGCMRDAYDFCIQGLKLEYGAEGNLAQPFLEKSIKEIQDAYVNQRRLRAGPDVRDGDIQFDPAGLQVQGYARRVVYPWNAHEPDRNSPEIVRFLNERLQNIAPKCEVRTVNLPALHGLEADAENESNPENREEVSVQLGLFAKEDIIPGETILHESSMLTATNRLHDDLCDACNSPLPELGSAEPSVACDNCDDTVFCSERCYKLACETYHGAICGEEGLASIGKDIQNPKDKADYLYLLLVARAFAMAETQKVHPLDLPEVKYIWGDFHRIEDDPCDAWAGRLPPPSATLPFSFQLNILQPMRILEEMGLDPFDSLRTYDTWVVNTLYAKFRGTASGRLSTWDGGPEVCAVHPLWCLANHSCDPNVRWEWGGEITFVARNETERVQWGSSEESERRKNDRGGFAIKKDEEILNHYCDLALVVKERREWAMGALGGPCQCSRCVWEESQS
ncbi:MYND domain-containing protein [Coccidioides immitis RS]|uniref:MYND domain-containing protein n=1 Tax=Coccidioides immitis (strain RS) TaxID=246410 RepID=J3KE80_COCIM|nr:MYND domain-containing protein [Coccidioides immitis RS]EAS33760.3 MYND domain-containing protein [Coccidioides immitis RS]TPX21409.1 hypothetical protein DIZ76_015366 [Coccidioides immitis]